ncbi:MAG: AbrB/MazE/SpoVT family DNA-binding domain-containing protein [Candidatus Binatus sp.]
MALKNGRRLKIDNSGRLVVPKRLRDHLGIHADTEVELTAQSDGILVRVVNEDSALVKVDGIWVHRGSPLPGANWDQVVDDVRAERIASILKSHK